MRHRLPVMSAHIRTAAALTAVLVVLSGCAAQPVQLSAPESPVLSSQPAGSPVDSITALIPAAPSDPDMTTSAKTSVVARTSPATSTAPARPGTAPRFGTGAHPIKVQVTGMVQIDATGKTVMCPPYPVAGVGTIDTEIPTPDCAHPIPVSGADTRKLAFAGHNKSHHWGNVHFEAMWNGSTITVLSQRLPEPSDQPDNLDPWTTACPAPPGGWKSGDAVGVRGYDRIQGAAGRGFGGLALGYPQGFPTNNDGKNPSGTLGNKQQVVVVGVTGDMAIATAAIRKVYGGNLCVVHAEYTDAAVTVQFGVLSKVMEKGGSRRLGIFSSSISQKPLGNPYLSVDVVVDTPEIQSQLAGLDDPPVLLKPWIQPID